MEKEKKEGGKEGGRKVFKLNLTLHRHNKDLGQQGGKRPGVLLSSQMAKNASGA